MLLMFPGLPPHFVGTARRIPALYRTPFPSRSTSTSKTFIMAQQRFPNSTASVVHLWCHLLIRASHATSREQSMPSARLISYANNIVPNSTNPSCTTENTGGERALVQFAGKSISSCVLEYRGTWTSLTFRQPSPPNALA